MPLSFRSIAASLALVGAVACGGGGERTTSPPPSTPTPTVQSVNVSQSAAPLTSIGQTTAVTAEVKLSNGAVGTQAVTWATSNAGVATVSGGTVTAVANGTATISATVGTVSGTTTITVAQAVASVRLLPTDTVMKTAGQLRAAALDARGNVVPGVALQWTAVTPAVMSVSSSGALTPVKTGVARVQVSAGSLTATSIVRTIWNVTKLSDLFPLYEYAASSGQRRALSDVSQSHADARAALIGPVWSYMETQLPTSGSPVTDLYFTTWPEIWQEASPFCGGVLLPNQDIYQSCASPTTTHWIVPGTSPNDFVLITRWISRQFLLASMTTSSAFPWFLAGYTQWLAGGSLQNGAIVGAPLKASINDFKTGDTQKLLVPLDTLVRTNNVKFFENLPQRTPVAVRQAQSALFVSYLSKEYPAVIPAILARIRATPGNVFTNDLLLQEILTRTGRTLAQLDAEYLVYARALQ